jgi:glycosyltransferase involved in cell wall biosynthesis
MRIGIFVLMAGRNAGGPETYEVELVRTLARLDRSHEYVIYCTGLEAKRAIAVDQDNFSYRILGPGLRPVSVGLTLPLMLAKDGVRFYHATFTPPPFSTTKLVFTMHCVSSLVHPEFYRPMVAWRLNRLLKIGMSAAQHVFCVSQTTRDHLHEMYAIPLDRMSVTYNGISPGFSPMPRAEAAEQVARQFGVSDPFILFVGKLQAHKNLERLAKAFQKFRQETGSKTKLLIAGRQAGTAVDIPALAERLGLADEIITTGYVPGSALPVLYNAARMFVFPSLWEGFGIPVLEAMSCGTPVIASNVTCLPEICGDAALTVDPLSIDALAEAIALLDASEPERARLVQAGFQRATLFSWENCARTTLQTYSKLLM